MGIIALGPLAIDLVGLPGSAHGARAGGFGQLRDDKVRQGSVGEREDMAGDDLVLLG